jgi:hypothetical protein
VETRFGAITKQWRIPMRVTVTCTPAIPTVIYCVPAVYIKYGNFALGVVHLISGYSCLPNYFRVNKYQVRELSAPSHEC